MAGLLANLIGWHRVRIWLESSAWTLRCATNGGERMNANAFWH